MFEVLYLVLGVIAAVAFVGGRLTLIAWVIRCYVSRRKSIGAQILFFACVLGMFLLADFYAFFSALAFSFSEKHKSMGFYDVAVVIILEAPSVAALVFLYKTRARAIFGCSK